MSVWCVRPPKREKNKTVWFCVHGAGQHAGMQLRSARQVGKDVYLGTYYCSSKSATTHIKTDSNKELQNGRGIPLFASTVHASPMQKSSSPTDKMKQKRKDRRSSGPLATHAGGEEGVRPPAQAAAQGKGKKQGHRGCARRGGHPPPIRARLGESSARSGRWGQVGRRSSSVEERRSRASGPHRRRPPYLQNSAARREPR
jgi:hypothetical protein